MASQNSVVPNDTLDMKTYQNPWIYVPVLYFLQALPVTLVSEVATLVYKDFGIANEDITRWTAIAALPWALQMLFGPLVDLNFTKRKWMLWGQGAIAVMLGSLAFLFHLPDPFAITLAVFFVIAITSTMCNVATDGFYLLALPKQAQAEFVGVQSTCYRLGSLFCKGALVAVAGHFIKTVGVPGVVNPGAANGWSIAFIIGAVVYALGWVECLISVPFPKADILKGTGTSVERNKNIRQTLSIITIGLSAYFAASAVVRLGAEALWAIFDGTSNGSLKGWHLSNNPKIISIPVGNSGILAEIGQLVFCLTALFFAIGYARRAIVGTEMGRAFSTYFQQSGIIAILLFLMFYRFGEAMVSKMAPLFLRDSVAQGGLGFSDQQIAWIVGTAGVIGLVCGGLLGGFVVGKYGLKRSFWYIAFAMHLPNLLYLWSSYAHPGIIPMYGVASVDQFGYGFGFSGYLVFQMQVARRGNFTTSHYALGVGIGALFISVAGILSGILQANLGYHAFFIAVILLTIPGLLTLFFIPLDKDTSPPTSTQDKLELLHSSEIE